MKKKLKIAVTGGMGSGKSVVCKILEEKGFPVIKADVLGKDLLKNDKDTITKIKSAFGNESYNGDEPNKKYLADVVFNDPEKLKKINSIIHPRTIDLIELRMKEALMSSDMVFVESALIFEAEREESFDYVILVYTDDEKKIKRIRERDNLSEGEINIRLNNQIPDLKKKDLADFVIDNNGSLDDLGEKVYFFLTLLKAM